MFQLTTPNKTLGDDDVSPVLLGGQLLNGYSHCP
jgi:hypothetical protein